VREQWANDNSSTVAALVRALAHAGEFADHADNRLRVAEIVARRLDVAPELVSRTLGGNLKTAPDGAIRSSANYIAIGGLASRPDPVQATWAYAQIVRWGQAPLAESLRLQAESVFRADIYDAVLGETEPRVARPDVIGAFMGPAFDGSDVAGYLSAWRTKRAYRPRLSVVR